MNRVLIIANICLLVLLFIVVTALFIHYKVKYKFDDMKEDKKYTKPKFICRINMSDFDYRKKTIKQYIGDIFLLSDKHRINYNNYKDCLEIENYPYEVVINAGYMYIYQKALN